MFRMTYLSVRTATISRFGEEKMMLVRGLPAIIRFSEGIAADQRGEPIRQTNTVISLCEQVLAQGTNF